MNKTALTQAMIDSPKPIRSASEFVTGHNRDRDFYIRPREGEKLDMEALVEKVKAFCALDDTLKRALTALIIVLAVSVTVAALLFDNDEVARFIGGVK
jgi:hypothetical protein